MQSPVILVVEDDPDLREALRVGLVAEGYVVEVACDGAEGGRRLRSTKIDVLVSDLGLPSIDGWDLIAHARAVGMQEKLHVIAMSGFTDARSRQRAFEAGCDQYVVKSEGVRGIVGAVRARFARAGAFAFAQ